MVSVLFSRMKALSLDFLHDRRGATVIEYGLLVGLISVTILLTLAAIGETIRDDVFGAISAALSSSASEGE
ncbi:MAG: Flp family type IVb pilin [Roseibium sp.]